MILLPKIVGIGPGLSYLKMLTGPFFNNSVTCKTL